MKHLRRQTSKSHTYSLDNTILGQKSAETTIAWTTGHLDNPLFDKWSLGQLSQQPQITVTRMDVENNEREKMVPNNHHYPEGSVTHSRFSL